MKNKERTVNCSVVTFRPAIRSYRLAKLTSALQKNDTTSIRSILKGRNLKELGHLVIEQSRDKHIQKITFHRPLSHAPSSLTKHIHSIPTNDPTSVQ